MIGVDTNILVRLFVTENAAQHKKAVEFFDDRSRSSPAFICLLVLMEFVWVLSNTYRVPKTRVLEVMDMILRKPDVFVEAEGIVRQAIVLAMKGQTDFADALIAGINERNGCIHTVTFDRKAAAKIPDMTLLA